MNTSSLLLPSNTSQTLAMAAAILTLVISPPVGAQSEGSATRPSPPARIGNHYNHKAYQPRAPDVCAAEKSSGIDCDSPAGMQAQRELESIERQLVPPKTSAPPATR